MVQKKIIAAIGNCDFYNRFFDTISTDMWREMKKAVDDKVSETVTFYDEKGRVIFIALFDLNDFYKDGLHVRLLIGNFLKYYEFVNLYFMGLAKYYGKNRVSFKTVRPTMKKFGEMLHCRLNEYGDYEKRVA